MNVRGALGTCVLSSFGPGVVLRYRVEDDMHEALSAIALAISWGNQGFKQDTLGCALNINKYNLIIYHALSIAIYLPTYLPAYLPT